MTQGCIWFALRRLKIIRKK
ncbi:MAG: hypothetical protein KAS59_05790 [Alphaproteobacteria bacterium]|nr:hypothetical protein [Alphaproteobacteria bacterium]